MTREDARLYGEEYLNDLMAASCDISEKHKEFVNMATKALSVEPCEDAISRAAAIKAMDDLEQEDIELYSCSIPEGFDGKRAIEALQSLPSVTPKQKMGRWIEHNHYGIKHIECSSCSAWVLSAYLVRKSYCPNCGAKMSENPTGSNCTACILDGTDACSRGAGRAVDGRVCEDFVGESEENIGPDKKG